MKLHEVIALILLGLGVLIALLFLFLGEWHLALIGVGVAAVGGYVLGEAIRHPQAPVSVTNHTHAVKTLPRGP